MMIRNMAIITWPGSDLLKDLKLPLYAIDDPLKFYYKIPKQYDAIIIANNNIIYDDLDIVEEIKKKLNSSPLIQPFSIAFNLDTGKYISYGRHKHINSEERVNPGLIWAIRRDVLTYELYKTLILYIKTEKHNDEMRHIDYIDARITYTSESSKPNKPLLPLSNNDEYEVNKMAILTCHFNPNEFKNPPNNLNRFVANLGTHVDDLFIAELVYDNQEPNLQEPNVKYYRGRRNDQLLWQKERLINSLIDNLHYLVQ